MMDEAADCEFWRARLHGAAANGIVRDVIVLPQTASTQDAARQHGLRSGVMVATLEQTAGRGRFGRRWRDSGRDGLAVTFVLPRDRPQRWAIAAAVAAANAIEAASNITVGIKWPNDILAPDGRKIAGVLVEQTGGFAVIGIGVNVHQQDWPPDLADRAVSLLQLGANPERIDLAVALLKSVASAHSRTDQELQDDFMLRDMLTGRLGLIRSGGDIIRGRIQRIEPMRGLSVRDSSGCEVWIDAEIASIERWGSQVR